jgi:hypothetical protein
MKICLVMLLFVVDAFAQSLGEPFWLVRLIRAPSAGPSFDASAIDQHRAAQVQSEVVGASSITGAAEVWLIEVHRSFTSIEATDRALAGVARSGGGGRDPESIFVRGTTMIGLFRNGLSYRAQEAIKAMPLARYLQISVYHTRPGTEHDFAELIKLRKIGLDSINLDKPELGYQIISGGGTGMYVFISPIASLAAVDNGFARLPVYTESFAQAGARAAKQIAYEADVNREHLLFRLEPRLSLVSDAFAGADPEFWRAR